jgi:hypothetical protein
MQEQDDSPRNASIFQTSTPETAAVSDTGEPSDDQDFTGDDLAEHFGQFSFESMKIKHFGSASTFALANSIAVRACSMHIFLNSPIHRSRNRSADNHHQVIQVPPYFRYYLCVFQSSWQTRANEFHVFSGSKKRATNSGGMSIRPTT